MKYIRVENNSVVGIPQDLPINAENISNFHLLPPDILRSYGWYPFEEEEMNLTENEKLIRWDIEIQLEKVVKKCIKRELTTEEIEQKNSAKLQKEWQDVRTKRNGLLLESDWTQLSDAPVQNKNDWEIYRKELRDITNISNPCNVIWPAKPIIIPLPPTPSENIPEDGEIVPE